MCHIAHGVADTVGQLKRAQKAGRLAEAMLDRRSKLKRCVVLRKVWTLVVMQMDCSDRFC